MEQLQLKYVEIDFDKESPQEIGTQINICGKIERPIENLEYKFIVGRGGIWNTIQEFSENNKCIWKPTGEGKYMVMVQAREKNGKKPLDYVAKEDYSIVSKKKQNIYNEEEINKNLNKQVIDETYSNIEENKYNVYEQDKILKKIKFKENIDDNIVLLEAKKITQQEREMLMSENLIGKNLKEIQDTQKNKIKEIENKSNTPTFNIIKEIKFTKEKTLGQKFDIEVIPIDGKEYLYRYYIKKNNDWSIIKEYDFCNICKFTAIEIGEKEFLIQAKRIESIENFEDYRIINIKVKDIQKIEITNFKCLNKDLVVGEKLKFEVETNINKLNQKEEMVLLYKFFKIYKDGKVICIQDYSTNNNVYYKEMDSGSYRILCLVKNILSNKEYDDRAILVYNIKPYKNIKIENFTSDLISPQQLGKSIKFSSKVQGGNNILYRYIINGAIKEDSGFIDKNEFLWTPTEAGEYEIILYVKDESYNGKYEAYEKLIFKIEKKREPVKILNITIDKEKKIIVGEPINIVVNADGGIKLEYSFTLRKEGRKIELVDFNKSNWTNFILNQPGEYEVEIRVRDKFSSKPYDVNTIIPLKAMEYLPGEIDYIILPYKDIHLIGDPIEFECIIQNTNNVLVKYETKLNGRSIEETNFSVNKKLRFIPKISGKYTIEVYAKNTKCKEEYDSKKQINLYISEASPVIETNIISNSLEGLEGRINKELTFEAISRGGKDVCYEFYLMKNSEWEKVQPYSRKHYYSFIPFTQGKYKILVLAKSYYKEVSYEDYASTTFYIKG